MASRTSSVGGINEAAKSSSVINAWAEAGVSNRLSHQL